MLRVQIGISGSRLIRTNTSELGSAAPAAAALEGILRNDTVSLVSRRVEVVLGALLESMERLHRLDIKRGEVKDIKLANDFEICLFWPKPANSSPTGVLV